MLSVVMVLTFSSLASVRGDDNMPTLDYDQVKALKDDPNYILIDVRQPDELKQDGSIPGAVNIPLDILKETLTNLPEKEFKSLYGRDKPGKDFNIIFSCRTGRRSAQAQIMAIELGYKKVFNYAGSITDWNKHNAQ